jgi:hypothetical protein
MAKTLPARPASWIIERVTDRRSLLRRLYDLDHKALNSRWGLLVVPWQWVPYRLGRRFGGRAERIAPYVWNPVVGSLWNRGREEGEPLPKKRKD